MKKTVKQVLSILLILSALVTLLISCTENKNKEKDDSYKVSLEGYKVIRTYDGSIELQTLFGRLRDALVEKTGVKKLTFAHDLNIEEDSGYEILLGQTNRKASKDALAELSDKIGSNAFIIKVTDTKIIITGHNDESIVFGVNYFIENFVETITAKDKTITFPEEGYTYMQSNTKTWMDTCEKLDDYAYSFAVIGDTQTIAHHSPEKLDYIYDWIVDNQNSHKIKFVMGLGDITDNSTADEWDVAKMNIAKLDGVVPYSLCRGNHDTSVTFNDAFKDGKYPSYLDGAFDEKLENTWQELIIGETKYLIMALDYGASDEILAWAGNVIAEHPEHNVIITTHAYLYRDGTTLDLGDVCPPSINGGYNNGDQMWNKLISQYENITLVLSGHDPCDKVVMTQTEGVNGNIVTQMLIDPQTMDVDYGPTGMVAMLYFSEDGRDVQVRYYSTIRNQYYTGDNQFDMKINAIGTDLPDVKEPDTDENGAKGDTDDVKENNSDNKTVLIVAISSTAVILAVGAVAAVIIVKKKKK